MREYLRAVQLFAPSCVGRVPVYRFPLLFYRHVLRMSIGDNSSLHWRTVFFPPEGSRWVPYSYR
jgi:hypothetical protein